MRSAWRGAPHEPWRGAPHEPWRGTSHEPRRTERGHRWRLPARRGAGGTGGAVRGCGLAATSRRRRGAGDRARRSAPPGRERRGGAADARRWRDPRRRAAGRGGRRVGGRPVLPRRAAHHLGPRVGPAARRADRRTAPGGRGRRSGTGAEAARRGIGGAGVLPRRRGRGPDGRPRLPLDVGVRAARRGTRPHQLVHAQRRAGRGPALQAAVRAHGPLDIKAMVGQMLQMGDEGHNRNRAGTLLLLRELVPHLVVSGLSSVDVAAVTRFIAGNDHFFLNLVMPSAKLQTAAAAGLPGSTVVTAMARNGTDFGIQVSGTGDAWFTGPAAVPSGLFLGGYGPDDANPDIGDSAITETAGLGGFAMAGAPAIVRFVGGSVSDALRTTQEMYEITLAENPAYPIPILDFRGAPTGIDVTRVLRTGLLPQINTGIAGRVAGTGQVGAGLVNPPMECFTGALEALAGR